MMATRQEIFALHRYFLWADRMRAHFNRQMGQRIRQSAGAEDVSTIMFVHPYMAYWYAATYVLIEGWRRLKLSDPEIDRLLKSRNIVYLKQYRNAAFHYHPEYFDKKLLAFISSADSVPWITQVREAFSQWFLKFLRQHGQEARK